ncbi:MAG: 30S ribosomal protein S11 [Phycisphaerales bacterium]|jgi:small subunit ribosomal protein S11|nr:30S ribosomal protein S11 [Phycisphaeraceae bacterium]
MSKKVKKIRKNVVRGIAHIRASQNNTLVTITDMNGETLCWDSAGSIGFKGTRKSTPFAATRAGENCGSKARKMGLQEIEVRIKGAGAGRESAVNGLVSTGLRVTALEDHTPVPHNGCRPPKRRRV